jgi:hypothetical protein
MLQSSTIALTVYPRFIWDRSCELHPPAEDYDWKAQFRTICRLARELHADPKGIAGAYWYGAGDTERWFIASMAAVDPLELEVFMLELAVDHGGWSHPMAPRSPMAR